MDAERHIIAQLYEERARLRRQLNLHGRNIDRTFATSRISEINQSLNRLEKR